MAHVRTAKTYDTTVMISKLTPDIVVGSILLVAAVVIRTCLFVHTVKYEKRFVFCAIINLHNVFPVTKLLNGNRAESFKKRQEVQLNAEVTTFN